MTMQSKSKVCRLLKKSRLELGCALMTLKSKSKVCTLNKIKPNGARIRNNDPKE